MLLRRRRNSDAATCKADHCTSASEDAPSAKPWRTMTVGLFLAIGAFQVGFHWAQHCTLPHRSKPLAFINYPQNELFSSNRDTIMSVLSRMGYHIETTDNRSAAPFDLYYTAIYPYVLNLSETEPSILRAYDELRGNQGRPGRRVSTFFSSRSITTKVNLATNRRLRQLGVVPRSFALPDDLEEFREFARSNRHARFLTKDSSHRGVRLIGGGVDEVERLARGGGAEKRFVQSYVDEPLLIDGRKFDLAVYTIMTSSRPVRVYALWSEWHFRFCNKDYDGGVDVEDVDRYVISDQWTPLWKMPVSGSYKEEEMYNWLG